MGRVAHCKAECRPVGPVPLIQDEAAGMAAKGDTEKPVCLRVNETLGKILTRKVWRAVQLSD